MRRVYVNARVHATGVADATALAVEDGVIAWIGSGESLGAYPAADRVDLDGGFLAPAFVDAHVHATATGQATDGLDLAGVRSAADLLAAVERAARAGRGRAVLGSGWDDSTWADPRLPNAAELDRAGYGGLVYLARVDAHSALVSSPLRSAAGAGKSGPLLSGPDHDAARRAALATASPGQVRDWQRSALRAAAALGIACVHEMAGPSISSADDLAGLLHLAADEPLPEVVGYWGELLGVETALELGAAGAAGDLFCDGSLGSHTAALNEPYADQPDTSGSLRFSTEELAEHIVRCTDAGIQAGFHAIGDAAIDQVLDAVDLCSQRLGRTGGAGHRLEHVEMPNDPRRLADSGLLASVQPGFDAAWGGPKGMYADRLGALRAAGTNPLAALAAAGVPLAFGSDSPVTPMDPWAAIRAAAHPHEPGWALSPRAAFTASTRAGWRAAGRPDEGILRPGAPATFAVWEAGDLAVDTPDERVARWSTDPRAAVPGLPDVAPGRSLPRCRLTVARGTVIYATD